MPARDTTLGRIRLRHLQCFLAVAQHGTLHRAAEALAISQPAVTKTLNELEQILGVRLFERGRRGAVITPEASVFLRHANASVTALQQAVDSTVRGRADVPVRIGVLPTVAPSVMPRVLQRFRSQRPQVEIVVMTGVNRGLLAQLRNRELDAVIGRLASPDEMIGLTFEALYAEPLVIVARPTHPLLKRAPLALDKIGQFPLIVPLAGTVIRHSADSFLGSRGVVPRLGLTETLSSSLAQRLVRDSDALWITPLSAAEGELAAGTLARLQVSTTGTEEPVGLLMRHDMLPSTALQTLLVAIREEARTRRETVR
jgi:LysR family transcriptional regulator, pca operon transcriptional activator